MLKIPFFEEIKSSKSILLAGCGGGFDIYSGIPLYLMLKSHNKNVHLANNTFTRINQVNGRKITPHCTIIDKDTKLPKIIGYDTFYCPEYYLTDYFFKNKGLDIPIYTLHPVGPKLLKETYQELTKELDLDTIVLIDGGTDSLMRGNESGLGTPEEDITSIVSVNSVPLKKKYLVCVGFGIDNYHGVSHYDVLKRIAALIKIGAFKGCFSLMKEMDEVKSYIEAVNYSNKRIGESKSIVQNSLTSAIKGEFGNHHSVARTKGSEQFINPLMAQVWCFDLEGVYNRLLYASILDGLVDLGQVGAKIFKFRENIRIRDRKPIPL